MMDQPYLTKVLFIFSLLIFIPNCKGQDSSNQSKQEPATFGKEVEKIDDEIWKIFQDSKNNYWFGSNGAGIFKYDGKTITQFTSKDGLISNQIRGIQEDKKGNLFFDTPDGVCLYDGKSIEFLKPINTEKNKWKLLKDDLWFTGNGNQKGAFRYDGKNLYQLEFPNFKLDEPNLRLSRYSVYSHYIDQAGNLWLGTLTAGVCRFDGESFDWIHEPEFFALEDGRTPSTRSIIEDKDGNFWLSNSIHRYRISDEPFSYEKLKGFEVGKEQAEMELPYYSSAVLEDSTNDLLIQSYGEGIFRFDGATVKHYPIIIDNQEVNSMCLYKDKTGALLIGTQGSGVLKFNGATFERF